MADLDGDHIVGGLVLSALILAGFVRGGGIVAAGAAAGGQEGETHRRSQSKSDPFFQFHSELLSVIRYPCCFSYSPQADHTLFFQAQDAPGLFGRGDLAAQQLGQRGGLGHQLAVALGQNALLQIQVVLKPDPDVTARWVAYFRRGGDGCLAVTSKNRGGVQGVKNAIETELAELLERRAVKGMAGAKIRVMVVGIPNVGKSTFINSFAGAARAKAADRPGVTRGKQWVTVGNYDLLDMPGVLWKKFDSMEVAGNLAFIGSIKDDVLDIEALATALLGEMQRMYPERLAERYRLTAEELGQDAYDLLETVGRKRGMLMSGGVVNTERAAITLVDEFRGAKLGRVSLERPEEA